MILKEEKVRLIESKQWFHSIEIEEGLVTPGRISLSHLRRMLDYLNFPKSFEGMTVLDIGAWDGFFSFEAEKRGAKRVVALDLDAPGYNGFSIAKELLQSRVEYVQGNAYELSPEVHGVFDIVFFFGVFYHLRYPLLALDKIRGVTGQYLLMETNCMDKRFIWADQSSEELENIDPRLTEVPLYRFYRFDELNPGDFSNWFSPNRRAVEDALWTAGFHPEFLAAWGDRIAYKGVKLPAIPEYLLETYEGTQWIDRRDGTQDRVVLPREQISDTTTRSGGDISGPRVHLPDAKESSALIESGAALPYFQIMEMQKDITRLSAQVTMMRKLLKTIRNGYTYRLLRRLGRWEWFQKAMADLQLD